MTKDNGHSSVKRCLRPTPISQWRYHVGTLSLIGILTTVVKAGSLPVPAAVLAEWRFDPDVNQLEVTLQNQATPQYFVLAQPPRIVLDLPNTQVGKVATQQSYSGAVRKVRVSQFQPDITRIVLELSPGVVLALGQMQLQRAPLTGKGDRWLLLPGIATQNTSNLSSIPSDNKGKQVIPSVISPIQTATTPPNTTLPPATIGSQQPAIVSVPPLISPSVKPEAARTNTSTPASKPVINFGQPLPITPVTTTPLPVLQPDTLVLPEITSSTTVEATPSVVVPNLDSTTSGTSTELIRQLPDTLLPPDVLLPAGAQLNLRYVGNSLTLKPGSPQQAELLLQSDLRSLTGKLIAPTGTPVVGRFETTGDGSYFIAQVIALQAQNIPFAAKSDILDNQAASTTKLESNQIIQIRLTENLPKF